VRTEDGYIIQQCLDGDSASFGFLVEKYKKAVYALAYSRIGNLHDSEDITQEVFVNAYRKLRDLRRWDNFMGWLHRITVNQCKMLIRARSRRPDSEFVEDQEPAMLDQPSLDSYHENMMYESIRESLDSLPEMYRQVMTLRYFGGMTVKEMARFLGVSPNTVDRRLRGALDRLKEEMPAMMNTAYEQNQLPASFTFRMVEMVRRVKIHTMPRMAGLPWGLSLAAGIIIAVMNLAPYLNMPNPASFPTSSPRSVEARLLKTGEIPVEILTGSQIPDTSGKREDIAKAIIFAENRVVSDDGQILFIRGGFGKAWEIWVMDADGKNEKLLGPGGFPAWSPDGKHIAFSQSKMDDPDNGDICIMDADGSNIKRLTEDPYDELCPKWSPDGKQIAYSIAGWKGKNGNWETPGAICVMNADGTNMRNLTGIRPNFHSYYIDWSPDGKRIVYEDRFLGPDGLGTSPVEIWAMDADGGNQEMLAIGTDPNWSPDGKAIVFESHLDAWNIWKSTDIYVMDADGANVKRLTDPGPSSEWFPKWSPNGTRIAFCSDRDDLDNPAGSDIYIMNADGTGIQRITNTPDNEAWIDWATFSHAVNPADKLPTKWGEVKSR